MNELKKTYADWVAVDWGTSNFRYWVIRSGEVICSGSKPLGIINLDQNSYERILIQELDFFLHPSRVTIILICGMAGSRQGWKEAPYISVPCRPPEFCDAISVKCMDARILVKILPGLEQNTPPDVMRGEETQIKGILTKHTNFDGVICLPGTHTKWVKISAGEIISFQTFMTGELFSLLGERSVLKHSISKDGWEEKTFKDSVDQIMSDNKLFASMLFRLRGKSILKNLPKVEARSCLSGYLIGLELSGSRPYWMGETVLIVGEHKISLAYEQGLTTQGVIVQRDSYNDASLQGLKEIYNSKKETSFF